MYRFSQVRLDKLPRLTPPSNTPDLAYFERGFQRPWLMHVSDWSSRALHPVENMLNYHREVYNVYANAALMLILDLPGLETLLTRYIQHGLDAYYTATGGFGGSSLEKWVILFSGIMLDAPEIYGTIDANNQSIFKTDEKTYYAGTGVMSGKSKIVPPGQGWTGAKVLFRHAIGEGEHEEFHPSEWATMPNGGNKGGGCKRESYRHCCNSKNWPGLALSAWFMNAKEIWNHPPFFDYVDRWMTENLAPFKDLADQYCSSIKSGMTAGSNFATAMWLTYRSKIPEQTGVKHNRLNPKSQTPNPKITINTGGLYYMDGKQVPGKVMASGVYLVPIEMDDGSMRFEKRIIIR
jgi:hypothetical protein